MPLINKTKTYKNDNVCKSKALAWLCLIENIGNKLPNYLTNVVIPFLNYCFAINSDTTSSSGENEPIIGENLMKFLQSRRSLGNSSIPSSPSNGNLPHSECLLKIGVEFYVSLLCGGSNKENFPEDIAKNLKYGN